MAKKFYSKKSLTSGMKAAHFAYSKEHLDVDQLGKDNETRIEVLTQAEYDAIGVKDENTLYFIY